MLLNLLIGKGGQIPEPIQDTFVSSSNEDEMFESNAFGDEKKHKQEGDELRDRIRELEQENTCFKTQNLGLKSRNILITGEGDEYRLELGESEEKFKGLERKLEKFGKEIAKGREENERLEQKIRALKENLQSKDDKAKSLRDLLKDRMSEIQSTNRANEELRERLDKREIEISRLRAEITELRNDVKEIVEDLKDDHENQLEQLLEREKKLTDTINQLSEDNQELSKELNKLQKETLEAEKRCLNSEMSLADEMSDKNKKLEQKESHQQVEKVDISTKMGIEYDSGGCNPETTPEDKVVDSGYHSLLAQGTSNHSECYELGQRHEIDRIIGMRVEHTLSDQSKIDDSVNDYSDSGLKNEQKLKEKLITRQGWSETNRILDEEYELIKKRLFSSCDSRLLMDSKLSFEDIVCTWVICTPNLTESQKKLNRELLNIIKGLDPCYYDPKEDRNCEYYTKKLTEFLRNNKNSQDLKTVLNLKRGESGLTILHLVSSVGKVTKEYNETVDLLLEAGADPNIQNNKGKTPLHYTDVLASVASLLKGKANPNIKDNKGETPLHYAASIGHADYVNLLLEKKANPNIQDRKGAIPLQVAIDNHHYYIEECFFTDKQKNLSEELYCILDKCFYAYEDCIWSKDEDRSGYAANFINFTKSLKEFLDKHKNSEDLKMIFSIRDGGGRSKILNHARAINKKVVDLLLSAGAVDPYKEGASLLDCRGSFYNVGEKYFVKSTLWNTPNQVKLNGFLSKISKAQDMCKLGEIVNEAIKSGVRFNFPKRSSQNEKAYNFVDCVIEKIGKLEKNPKVASDIICKLVSRGAVFGNKIDIDVIDILDEFKDHKANMIKAYADYISNAHKFIEIAKSATNSELNDVRIDSSTFYLKYSEDSKIDVAKITDGARSLGLTQGSIEYGRDLIKIGKSEVEIITEKGIRNYTDLADDSDIVLTFHTSLGELEVRLYPDMQDLIRVEVADQNTLERLEDHKEKIGKNCLLGGLSVNEAIKRGFFDRPRKLIHSETISQSNETKVGLWEEREKMRKAPSLKETGSRSI